MPTRTSTTRLLCMAAGMVLLGAGVAPAAMLTFGVNNGNLALGELDLGNAFAGQNQPGSATWTNPAGAGFDVKFAGANWDAENPAGSIKTVAISAVTIEFFLTGTTTPVDVTGFSILFGDLDVGTPMKNFAITSGGVEQPLSVASYFTLGASLTASGANIQSGKSTGSNTFADPAINALLNMGTTGISKLTFTTTDFVHIGNGTLANMAIVPEPATMALLAFGGMAALKRRR